MFTKIHLRHKFLILPVLIVAAAVLPSGFLIIQARAESSADANASISFKKDPSSGLFAITISDPQGIQEFSLKPPQKFSYGGLIGGCPRTRKIDNVNFADPFDFEPKMDGYVVDCNDSRTEFEIPAPKDGATSGMRLLLKPKPAEEAPAPAPAPATPAAPAGGAAPAPSPAEASKAVEITYPVPELGNCKNEAECRSYCDQPANLEKCVAFAESHNLMTAEEAAQAKKFNKLLSSGSTPGGCNSQKSCESYCNDVGRMDQCLAFGEKNGFLKGKELEEAKKVQAALQKGAKMPGDCRNKTACDAYCKSPEHIDECVAFAKDNGFMSEEEAREVEKFLPLMKRGETPGGCKTKDECEAYCDSGENMDECFEFAKKAGLVSEEDAKHFEKFKKAGGVGPGGCRGRSCKSFCEKPENQKVCFKWAKENGMLEEKDLRRMEEGRQQLRGALEQAPPEAKACIEEAIPGGLAAMESGEFFGGPEIGDKIRECFESAFSQFGGPGGPGGCSSPEECQAYCQDNPEECQDFQPPTGGPPGGGGGFGGPGGCKSIDECMAYCQEHLDECSGFGPPGGGGFPGEPGGGPPSGFPGAPGGFPGGGATGGEFPSGPGGCKNQEECIAYCKDNPQDCGGGSGLPGGGQGGGGFPGERRDFKGPRNAEECAKQGGSWGDSKCNFRDQSMENIGIDHGGEECIKQGGNWDGKNCNFSQQQQFQQQTPTDFHLPAGSGFPSGIPSGGTGGPSPEEIKKQYQQQMEQQIQQQIQQQYQQQFQQQQQNFQPPTNIAPPPPSSQGPRMPKPLFLLGRLITVLLGGN